MRLHSHFSNEEQAGSASVSPPKSLELRERADVGCVYLHAATDAARVIETGSAAAGVELPAQPGLINRAGRYSAIWLTPRAWLLLCSIDDEIELASRVNIVFPDKRLHAALFTDYLQWIELRGESAERVLQHGGFISLEPDGLAIGHAKRTLVANVAVVVVHERKFDWLVAIECSRARYLMKWLNVCACS